MSEAAEAALGQAGETVTPNRGGTPHEVTQVKRDQVKLLAAAGTRQDMIARLLHMGKDTLVEHYQIELITGKTEANGLVAQALFTSAMKAGTKDEKGWNVTAAIFWMKSQGGWSDHGSLDPELRAMLDEMKRKRAEMEAATIAAPDDEEKVIEVHGL